MDILDEDLDDSALDCMSLIKKRKAISNLNCKNSKQIKLTVAPPSAKRNEGVGLNEAQEGGKGEGCSFELKETRSGYFDGIQTSHACPLCLRGFENETNYSAHMKQCAKKRKMTTQQLLSALELQKKQMKERKALGLCPQISLPRKPKKKINPDQNSRSDFDLALGLALSKSLETNEPTSNVAQATIPTLEEFGFKSSSNPSEPTKKKGKNLKSILRERTEEERQRIITEKAAVVLLDEPEENEKQNTKQNVANSQLKLQNQVPHLWSLGENEMECEWYVKELRELVVTKEEIPPDPTPALPENIQDDVLKLKLPEGKIHEDWRKMINEEKYSDVRGKSKDGRNYYLHSVILFARCPTVLDRDLGSIFKKYNLSTVLVFFEFAYCGTLNGLTREEVEELLRLAVDVGHEDLIRVLNCLGVSSTQSSSEGMIPSSLTPDLIIEEKEEPEVTIVAEDADIFDENMVDLTQSSHGSSTVEVPEDEPNADKSYWSFLQHEKEMEEWEEMRRREEEKENTEITTEMEKIETSMKQQHEMMQQILNEFEENESDLKNKLQLEKICQMQRRESNDSETKDADFGKRTDGDDCILISSDSETQASKTDAKDIKPTDEIDYDIPYFDPYGDFNHFSPVRGFQEDERSQSFITGDVSFSHKNVQEEIEDRQDVQEQRKSSPEYCSTPVTNRQASRVDSSVRKSLNKSKKRRSNLSASRIIRKSLGLKTRGRKKSDKKSLKGGKKLAEALTSSILSELSKSPLFKSSTPLRSRRVIEMTPSATKDSEFGECVTPSPNYSDMGDSAMKEHLARYGLKRNLAKSKAKKILRHIYEELHPIINTKTGKLVKILPGDSPKPRKKPTRSKSKSCKTAATKKTKETRLTSSRDSVSTGSVCSLDKSTDYDSDGSEFGDLNEPLTQSVPNNPVDLPSALSEFLARNPEFHQKILLYEPIWLEELQKNLKETFKKHFKLADLMDYLDQKCITFRSAAQKRNNQKRNEKKRNSPKKKKIPPG